MANLCNGGPYIWTTWLPGCYLEEAPASGPAGSKPSTRGTPRATQDQDQRPAGRTFSQGPRTRAGQVLMAVALISATYKDSYDERQCWERRNRWMLKTAGTGLGL